MCGVGMLVCWYVGVLTVYVGVSTESKGDHNTAAFTRLGYLSLDSNERSNYKARELKSVYVHTKGSYLKFVIKANHVSQQNLFNQVSLIAVRIVGVGGSAPVGGYNPDTDVGVELVVDARTAKEMRELAVRKELAIRREDYELAKQLKTDIANLKKVHSSRVDSIRFSSMLCVVSHYRFSPACVID